MHTNAKIGLVLFLFLIIYFLCRVGVRLARNDLDKMKIPAWLFTIIATVVGLFVLFGEKSEAGLFGVIGVLPIFTYITIRLILLLG